jgi:hypothetical protein
MLRGCLLLALSAWLVAPSAAYDYPPSPPINYKSYAAMTKLLLDLNATFPDVVQVSVAQETYDLPFPEELQCIVDDETQDTETCKQFVVHLTNHSTLASDPERPEVFISGALHGNERVGPNTAIELVALVAHATSSYGTDEAVKPTVDTQRWLKELVNTRNVLVTPMTNAWGYSHNHREELKVDPNRDYNYMRSGADCMQTMTSRVVNEIWRDHVFQLAVTFHGGTRAVSYEWGSPDHYLDGDEKKPSEKSPDHMAQFQIGNTLANFAGVFPDGKLYPTGTMNDVVYGGSSKPLDSCVDISAPFLTVCFHCCCLLQSRAAWRIGAMLRRGRTSSTTRSRSLFTRASRPLLGGTRRRKRSTTTSPTVRSTCWWKRRRARSPEQATWATSRSCTKRTSTSSEPKELRPSSWAMCLATSALRS